MGEKTPFDKQSRLKERDNDNVNDNGPQFLMHFEIKNLNIKIFTKWQKLFKISFGVPVLVVGNLWNMSILQI